MSERPQVVLFNPDSEERAEWERALSATAHLRAAANAFELTALLTARAADVLVAPCDPKLLDALQRCRGNARLILCGATLPEGVIDAAGQGYDLRHVAEPQHLRREVLMLARPRSVMVRHRVHGLTLLHAGIERPAEVLDLSNRGLSFRLELDEQLESYLPGTQLQPIQVLRGDQLVLQADRVQVRYIEQAHDAERRPFYRIGCELPLGAVQMPAGKALRIDDAATRLGLLRATLRMGGIYLQRVDDDGEGLLCERGHAHLENETLQLDAVGPYEPYDVVRGTFEIGGSSYRFVTSVIESQPLTLRLPTVIEAAHRRSAARYRPTPQMPIVAKLSTALSPGALPSREILEISSTGLSFAIDPRVDLFPPGLKLSQLSLKLGAFQLNCAAEVRNLSPLARDNAGLRCGVVFAGLSTEERTQLADALMCHRFPGLADGGEFPFEQLWGFFEETRFIYPEKMDQLAPILPQVRDTFRKLQAQPGRLFKSVIFHEDRQLYAHLSAVRAYGHTFVVQHLAGTTRLHGRQGPRIVNLGISEYFSQSQDLEFIKVYFRPNNKWPARVFGGYARKVTDRQRSDLRTFDYRLLDTSQTLAETPGIRVIEARGADLSEVEGHFVGAERGLILRADDLTRGTLPLHGVDEMFRASGLYRQRTVLLAVRGGRPVGFALCEISSPGLNLSELLSSFRVVLLPDAATHAADPSGAQVQTALVREALQFYRRAERPYVPLLQPAGAEALPGVGEAQTPKQYSCWTCHRNLFRHFSEHVDRLYEVLEATAEKRALRSARNLAVADAPGDAA